MSAATYVVNSQDTFLSIVSISMDSEHTNLGRHKYNDAQCHGVCNFSGQLQNNGSCSIYNHVAKLFVPLALQPQFGPWPTSMKLSISLRFTRS
jgi:hypothetical protein